MARWMQLSRTGPMLMVLLVLGLAGCEEKVTLQNYEQIQDGMTLAEVELILGEGKLEESSGRSIGAAGMVESADAGVEDRLYVWESGNKMIIVRIMDGKVTSTQKRGL